MLPKGQALAIGWMHNTIWMCQSSPKIHLLDNASFPCRHCCLEGTGEDAVAMVVCAMWMTCWVCNASVSKGVILTQCPWHRKSTGRSHGHAEFLQAGWQQLLSAPALHNPSRAFCMTCARTARTQANTCSQSGLHSSGLNLADPAWSSPAS